MGKGTPAGERSRLRRISDLLGIEPESLGLVASLYVPKTAEQVEEIVDRVWSLMDEVRVSLIYGGEIESGQSQAIEAARLSRMQGHQRRLERIQNIKRYLHQQSLTFGKAEMELDEALSGPVEQWNAPLS